jgi:hypothetical protein
MHIAKLITSSCIKLVIYNFNFLDCNFKKYFLDIETNVV